MKVFSSKKYLEYVSERHGSQYAKAMSAWSTKINGMTKKEIGESGFVAIDCGMIEKEKWLADKVFSKKKFTEVMCKMVEDADAADAKWVNLCDGLTQEEMVRFLYIADDNWMVSREEWLEEKKGKVDKEAEDDRQ